MADERPEEILTVSELTHRVRRSLEDDFDSVCVVGEISNVGRPASGHIYLTLKDSGAQLATVIWRSTASRSMGAWGKVSLNHPFRKRTCSSSSP